MLEKIDYYGFLILLGAACALSISGVLFGNF